MGSILEADSGSDPTPIHTMRAVRRCHRMSEQPPAYLTKSRYTDAQCSMSVEPVGDQGDHDLVITFEGGISIRLPLTIERAHGLITLLTGATASGRHGRPLGFSPR